LTSIIKKWDQTISSGKLSQRIMNTVRSESPLKNKIDDAQQKLQFQVSKLGVITDKLQKKQDIVFHKIVEAQKNK